MARGGGRRPDRAAALAARLRPLLHRRPVVLLGATAQRVAQPLRDQGRPDADLRGPLRGAVAGQPPGGRAPGAPGALARRRGRVRQALPGGGRALRRPAPHRPGGGAGADRGIPGPRRVAELDPVPERRAVRGEGPAVPQGRGLLRLQAPLRAVPRPLGTGGALRHPGGDRGQPLPQRWHPPPGRPAPGPPGGQGPHLGDPGPHRPGQGGRLLPGPVLARPLLQRLRQGRLLDRRPRPHPRSRAPDPGVAGRLRAAALQHPAPGLGPAGDRGRAVVRGGAVRRRHLPGGGPGPQGQSGPVDPGGAVHPAEHQRHPHRPRPQRGAERQLPGGLQPDRRPADRQQRHAGQRAAVGPPAHPGHLRQAPGLPVVLPVQLPGHGPLPGQRVGGDAGGGGRARDQRPGPPLPVVDQHPPGLHPRVRDDHLPGDAADEQRRPRVRRRVGAPGVHQRAGPGHPAVGLLRPGQLRVRDRQHQGPGNRLPAGQRAERGHPLLGRRRRAAVVVLQAVHVRRPVQRREPAHLQPGDQLVAAHLRPGGAGPGDQGGAVPQPGRRPLLGAGQRPDRVDPGRLHHHRQLPLRPGRRHQLGGVGQRAAEHPGELRAELGEGGHQRLHREDDLLRDGSERPDHPDLREGLPRHVHAGVEDGLGPQGPHPVPRGHLHHPGRHVRQVPHHQRPGLLQRGGRLDAVAVAGVGVAVPGAGHHPDHQRPGPGGLHRAAGADGADLPGAAGAEPDPAELHPAGRLRAGVVEQPDPDPLGVHDRRVGPGPVREDRHVHHPAGPTGRRPGTGGGAHRRQPVDLQGDQPPQPGGLDGAAGERADDPGGAVAAVRPAAVRPVVAEQLPRAAGGHRRLRQAGRLRGHPGLGAVAGLLRPGVDHPDVGGQRHPVAAGDLVAGPGPGVLRPGPGRPPRRQPRGLPERHRRPRGRPAAHPAADRDGGGAGGRRGHADHHADDDHAHHGAADDHHDEAGQDDGHHHVDADGQGDHGDHRPGLTGDGRRLSRRVPRRRR